MIFKKFITPRCPGLEAFPEPCQIDGAFGKRSNSLNLLTVLAKRSLAISTPVSSHHAIISV